MVKDEDNVICEDCNTKGLIEHGIQILKNQEDANNPNNFRMIHVDEFYRLHIIEERLKKEKESMSDSIHDYHAYEVEEILEKIIEGAEKLERIDSLFAELEIPPPYDLWLAESLQIRESLKKEFEYYDIAFKKHKDIDDFKIAQVLQKILGKEKPQRITSTKEGRKFLGDFEATA